MPGRKRIRDAALLFAISLAAPSFAQQAHEVRITATEFSFEPAKIKLPQGEVKFVVTNRGSFPHSLAIVARKEKIRFIDSGETKSLTVKLDKEEELVFYCAQPGHRERGMEGKISVGKK